MRERVKRCVGSPEAASTLQLQLADALGKIRSQHEKIETLGRALDDAKADATKAGEMEIRVRELEERERLVRIRLREIVDADDGESDDLLRLSCAALRRVRMLERGQLAQRVAEAQLRDVRRECGEPFVVPALLDAMMCLSAATSGLSSG
ncbi:hypothetical protein OF83DRAFT_354590 [Amylostereum chailletii]|nr:hypothetical protein OF83DRAFT_354590 [Amylostereum chailletii]